MIGSFNQMVLRACEGEGSLPFEGLISELGSELPTVPEPAAGRAASSSRPLVSLCIEWALPHFPKLGSFLF